jgi:maltose alpha-D-glucosyltransferase/alpha-amylase
MQAMDEDAKIPFGNGHIAFATTGVFRELAGDAPAELPVHRPHIDSSNTTLFIGDKLFLKGYRQIQQGVSLEWEIGRFLTEMSPFDHVVPIAGTMFYEDPDGHASSLALLQSLVANQGNAWDYTQDMLKRFLEDCLVEPEKMGVDAEGYPGVYLMQVRILGQRTGELHRALAKETGEPDFDPEPMGAKDCQALVKALSEDVEHTLAKLERSLGSLPETQRPAAEGLVGMKSAALARIAGFDLGGLNALKTRFHGDYHLGQVLLRRNDFIIIDFEGEPARPLAERRRKQSPLKDVAGMLRSFDYAAFAALSAASAENPHQREVLEPFTREWTHWASQAFLEGYEQALAGDPCYPADADHARVLISLFSLEKALYELRYELDNRPTWVDVPLRGLLELLG